MLMVCPSCGTLNRIPENKPHVEGMCGKCKQALHTFKPADLNDVSFYHFVQKSELPVVVDFWASWCGPCKMMGPIFEKTASESPNLLFAKVNTESAQQVGMNYGIQSIPTLIMFHKGKEVQRMSGALMEQQLKQWLLQGLQSI